MTRRSHGEGADFGLGRVGSPATSPNFPNFSACRTLSSPRASARGAVADRSRRLRQRPPEGAPGSRLAADGPLSLNGDAKGISPIIAERLSPNRMPSPRRRCYSGRWAPPATPRNAISFNCSTSRFPLQADAKTYCEHSLQDRNLIASEGELLIAAKRRHRQRLAPQTPRAESRMNSLAIAWPRGST